MNEPSIPFAAMVLDLLGESAEHLLPPATLTCVHVAPPDRGDTDPGLIDVESAAVWSDLARAVQASQ